MRKLHTAQQTSCQPLYQRLSSKSNQLRMQICFTSVDLWLPARMHPRVSLALIFFFILRECWFCNSHPPVAAEIPIFCVRLHRRPGYNSEMSDASWRVPLLQCFHCDAILLSPHSLQLSLCFCKQSITNPVCQCTNIFLNTWKPHSYKSYASFK